MGASVEDDPGASGYVGGGGKFRHSAFDHPLDGHGPRRQLSYKYRTISKSKENSPWLQMNIYHNLTWMPVFMKTPIPAMARLWWGAGGVGPRANRARPTPTPPPPRGSSQFHQHPARPPRYASRQGQSKQVGGGTATARHTPADTTRRGWLRRGSLWPEAKPGNWSRAAPLLSHPQPQSNSGQTAPQSHLWLPRFSGSARPARSAVESATFVDVYTAPKSRYSTIRMLAFDSRRTACGPKATGFKHTGSQHVEPRRHWSGALTLKRLMHRP